MKDEVIDIDSNGDVQQVLSQGIQEINGQYKQIDIENKGYDTLQKLLFEYGKQLLLQFDVANETVETLKAKHMKLLVAPPGVNAQFSHRDGFEPPGLVMAFYLSDT